MASVVGSKFLRFLLVLYFAEAGALLALSPWSRFWLRRVVARSPEALQGLLLSPYFRSLIVGIGFLHLWVAVTELEAWRKSVFGGRTASAPPAGP